MSFEAGDKVKCIVDGTMGLVLDKIYTVANITTYNAGYGNIVAGIYVNSGIGPYPEEYFEFHSRKQKAPPKRRKLVI